MKLILTTIIWSFSIGLMGQDLTDDIKAFHNLMINYKINNRNKVALSYTGIGDVPSYQFTYHQIGLSYGRRINKKDWITVNADRINILQRDDDTYRNYSRVGIEYSHPARWKKFDIDHEISGEAYFPAFAKFQYRWMYDLSLTYRKSFTGLRIRPFTSFRLYYYSGGNIISYYDEEGETVAMKSPNDIHRWRWYLGIKTRLMRNLNLNVSYMHNEEFNASINRYSDINIYNRNKTAVRLPFNSYDAVVMSLVYSFKLKKKKKEDTNTEVIEEEEKD